MFFARALHAHRRGEVLQGREIAAGVFLFFLNEEDVFFVDGGPILLYSSACGGIYQNGYIYILTTV